jgi:transposase-like protein
MSEPAIVCPSCHSEHVVKNGRIDNGKQNYRCYDCRRQFVLNPQNKVIAQATKTLIDRLLLEKIPLAGIARAAEVSEPWLQQYVNAKYAEVPRKLTVRSKKKDG